MKEKVYLVRLGVPAVAWVELSVMAEDVSSAVDKAKKARISLPIEHYQIQFLEGVGMDYEAAEEIIN